MFRTRPALAWTGETGPKLSGALTNCAEAGGDCSVLNSESAVSQRGQRIRSGRLPRREKGCEERDRHHDRCPTGKCDRIARANAVEERADGSTHSCRHDDSNCRANGGEPGATTEETPHHVATLRADRHPDPDFVR